MPKSVLRAVLGRVQFTLHATRRTPHGASGLVQAMSAWSVKTRRAPSSQCGDARVYGHTTTAMHEYRVHPPPPRNAALQVGLSRMQLTLRATPLDTSRRVALGASNVCLAGESPTCSVPAMWGCEGHTTMVLRLRP